jgi:hypothetical protein
MISKGIVMKSTRIDLDAVSVLLQERCPFITFALLGGPDKDGCMAAGEKLELSVFLDGGIGTWTAIEKILPVMTVIVPGVFCEVTLLNNVDPATRYRAMQEICLFIQKGQEPVFNEFGKRSSLDYRIMRAHQRRTGMPGAD